MLTLSLLRHAKSSWADRELDDHERPLATRGIKAAGAMGAFIAREGLRPDLILCSGSVRTRATLALVLELTGKGSREDVEAMATKFPTCALAVLTFKVRKWPDVGSGAGTLELFMPPRRLL